MPKIVSSFLASCDCAAVVPSCFLKASVSESTPCTCSLRLDKNWSLRLPVRSVNAVRPCTRPNALFMLSPIGPAAALTASMAGTRPPFAAISFCPASAPINPICCNTSAISDVGFMRAIVAPLNAVCASLAVIPLLVSAAVAALNSCSFTPAVAIIGAVDPKLSLRASILVLPSFTVRKKEFAICSAVSP